MIIIHTSGIDFKAATLTLLNYHTTIFSALLDICARILCKNSQSLNIL